MFTDWQTAAGIVTCEGPGDCNFCSLVEMINSIVQWLVMFGVVIIVLILAWAGVILLTSGGDASKLTQAKKMFFNSLIGMLIIMASWTVVDTFLKVFTGSDLGVWNAPTENCGGSNPAGDATHEASVVPETKAHLQKNTLSYQQSHLG